MSQELEDVPVCSGCGHPMAETKSPNAQLLHGVVPYDCQSNEECSQYAPEGIGSYSAVDLSVVADSHTQDTNIVLQSFKTEPVCVQCGSKNLFMPDGVTSQSDLTDDSTIICGECGAAITYGTIVNSWKARVTDHLTDIGILGGTK